MKYIKFDSLIDKWKSLRSELVMSQIRESLFKDKKWNEIERRNSWKITKEFEIKTRRNERKLKRLIWKWIHFKLTLKIISCA